MIRKTLFALTLATGAMAAPAMAATTSTTTSVHTHYCNCGHTQGAGQCGSTTTSGGTTTTSGGTTSTTSGGTSSGGPSSSGGTAVPEPGMLGIMGMGLVGLAYARRRKARA